MTVTSWGRIFVDRFKAGDDDRAIATILTRDNREFRAYPHEIEVLDTFPAAWVVCGHTVIPESEIVRAEVTGHLGESSGQDEAE